MSEVIAHTVVVRNGKAQETYRHIVAVGMGHRLPNLVLVQRAPEMPEMVIDINHLHFTSYTVRKPRTRERA